MLNPVAEGIWDATQPLRVAGFDLGHRMTILRLRNGEVVVHSPIQYSSAVGRDVDAIGPVKYILAPSSMHDLYLAEWMNAYGEATLFHSPALNPKPIDSGRTKPLERGALDGLEAIPIEGMPRIQEWVFRDPASRTLIVCDLVFNLPPGRGLQKVLQKLNGIYEQVGPSKFFKSFISHDAAFRASIQELLSLEFDRMIVGHGSNVNGHAREYVARAFDWLRLK
jgi:hypothetical protein